MSLSVLTRKSIADVTRRKGRTALMIIGIVIGVLGLTAVNIANEMIGAAFVFSNDTSSVPDMVFNLDTVPASVIDSLRQVPNVAKFQVRTSFMTNWNLGNGGSSPIQINAYPDMTHVQLGTFQVTSGRLPGVGEIVMDSSDQQIEPITLGDTVKLDTASGSTISLRVVGFARTADQNLSAPATGYMSANGLQQIVNTASSQIGLSTSLARQVIPNGGSPGGPQQKGPGLPALTTDILVKASDAAHVRPVFDSCLQILNHMSAQRLQVNLNDPKGDVINVQIAVPGLLNIIAALALVAVLLVCLMIFNTVNTLLSEQIKIIGTMKSIGGTSRRIVGSYLLSISIYGIVGTIVGIGLGVLAGWQLSYLVAHLAHVDLGPFLLAPWIILFSIAIGLLAPLLSALLPLWTGTRITVHEAMSAYGVSVGAGKKPIMWGSALSGVSQTALLGLRGTFRKPGRATITLLALTLSGAVFMAVQVTNGSLGAALDHSANVFSNDLSVFVDSSKTQSALTVLQAVQGVSIVEPNTTDTVTTSAGQLQLVGLPANTRIYQPHIVSGRWLTNNENGTLVLSDLAAQRLNVQVGSMVTVQLGTHRASWQLVGIVHELANATGSANVGGPVGMGFTTLQNMNVNLEKLAANSALRLMVVTQDHTLSAVRQLQGTIQDALKNAGVGGFGIDVTGQRTADSSELIVYSLFYTVALIVALVGLLSLSNTLSAETLERRLEIGILRSLGATGRRVGLVFWIEGLVLAVSAWALGALVGLPLGTLILNQLSVVAFPIEVLFNPLFVLTTLVFVIVVSFFASYGPSLGASRVRIREILRYE